MLRDIVRRTHPKADMDALQRLCAALVEENDALRLENAKLRAENRHLRRRLRDAELRTLRRAEADALFMGALRYAQLPTSRAASLGYGISRRRWSWAMALITVAGLRDHGGEWLDVPAESYEAALQHAVHRVERDGAQVLTAKLPKNGYSGEHRTHPRAAAGHAHSHAQRAERDQSTRGF